MVIKISCFQEAALKYIYIYIQYFHDFTYMFTTFYQIFPGFPLFNTYFWVAGATRELAQDLNQSPSIAAYRV